jgi:hypothetical protein
MYKKCSFSLIIAVSDMLKLPNMRSVFIVNFNELGTDHSLVSEWSSEGYSLYLV